MEDYFDDATLQNVLNELPDLDLNRSRLTNRRFRDVIDDQVFWKNRIRKVFGVEPETDNPKEEYIYRKTYPVGFKMNMNYLLKVIRVTDNETIIFDDSKLVKVSNAYILDKISHAFDIMEYGGLYTVSWKYPNTSTDNNFMVSFLGNPILKEAIRQSPRYNSSENPTDFDDFPIQSDKAYLYHIGYTLTMKDILKLIPCFKNEVIIWDGDYNKLRKRNMIDVINEFENSQIDIHVKFDYELRDGYHSFGLNCFLVNQQNKPLIDIINRKAGSIVIDI